MYNAEGGAVSLTILNVTVRPYQVMAVDGKDDDTFLGSFPVIALSDNYAINTDAAGFEIGAGVIYQKGVFSLVDPQVVIVNPTSSDVSGYSVGFKSVEEIVDENADESLYDPAFFDGSVNPNAPGAHRLRVTPTLIAVATEDLSATIASEEYMPLFEFNEDGQITIKRTDAQYSALGQELARRTVEESGNFVVNDMFVKIKDVNVDTKDFRYYVSPGIAYVNGRRVEVLNPIEIQSRMGVDASSEIQLNSAVQSLFTSGVQDLLAVKKLHFAPGKTIRDASVVLVIEGASGSTIRSQVDAASGSTYAFADYDTSSLLSTDLKGRGIVLGQTDALTNEYTLTPCVFPEATQPIINASTSIALYLEEDSDDDGIHAVVAIGVDPMHGRINSGIPLYAGIANSGTMVETGTTVSAAKELTVDVSAPIGNVLSVDPTAVLPNAIQRLTGFTALSDISYTFTATSITTAVASGGTVAAVVFNDLADVASDYVEVGDVVVIGGNSHTVVSVGVSGPRHFGILTGAATTATTYTTWQRVYKTGRHIAAIPSFNARPFTVSDFNSLTWKKGFTSSAISVRVVYATTEATHRPMPSTPPVSGPRIGRSLESQRCGMPPASPLEAAPSRARD